MARPAATAETGTAAVTGDDATERPAVPGRPGGGRPLGSAVVSDLPAARPLRRRPHAHPGAGRRARRCRATRRPSPTPSRRRCAALGGLEVERVGNTVLARTNLDLPTRVVLAGHLDTVPIADNVPSELREVDGVQRLYGCGTSDMKSGDAVMLRLAGRFGVPGARARARPHVRLLRQRGGRARARTGSAGWRGSGGAGSTATSPILLEPTDGEIEAGCQGTLRARARRARAGGRTAPAAGSGVNAIHGAGRILATLAAYEPREVEIDGCTYREGLNAVGDPRRRRRQRDPRRGRR